MAMPPESAPRARKVIEAYGDGGFRIAGERIEGSVIVFPERWLAWPVSGPEGVDLSSLSVVIDVAARVDVLLLGLGRSPAVAFRGLRDDLRNHGIGLETMDTGAACRTYNILLAEGRSVAAALIAV